MTQRKMTRLEWLWVLLAGAVLMPLPASQAGSAGDEILESTGTILKTPPTAEFIDAALFSLQVPTYPSDGFSVMLPIEGEHLAIDLTRRTRFANFMILEGRESTLFPRKAPPCRAYRGVIRGKPGSAAALSLRRHGLEGMIQTPEGERYFIQPLSSGERGTHVIYRSSRTEESAWCEAISIAPPTDEPDPPMHGGLAGAGAKSLRMLVETDHPFLLLNDEDPDIMIADVESIYNVVDLVYERDLDLNVYLGGIIIRDQGSSYSGTTSYELLCDLTETWSMYYDLWTFDAVQLLTGIELEGPIGTAYLNSVCSGTIQACQTVTPFWALSVVESRFNQNHDLRVALSAHEIAHNLSAAHCSGSACNIMCPSIGMCGGASGTNLRFGTVSRLVIDSYLADASCLPNRTLLDLPLEDQFNPNNTGEIEAPNPQKWFHAASARVSPQIPNEPSGNSSLTMNGQYGHESIKASITSHPFNLHQYRDVSVSFWAGYWGTGNLPDLEVEYLGQDRTWHLADSIPITEAYQAFVEFTVEIPDEACWEGAMIRIATDIHGETLTEIWGVDDLLIDGTPFTGTANDECTEAAPLQNGLSEFETLGATASADQLGCGGSPDLGMLADNWYAYTATCSGDLLMVTCGLVDFDSRITLYRKSDCDEGTLVPMACDMPDPPTCNGAPGSLLEARVTEGEAYLLRIGSMDGSTGSGQIYIGCTPVEDPPCPADLDGDGVIGGADIALLLGSWSTAEGDLDGDGTTGGSDLATVLGSWGPCPE